MSIASENPLVVARQAARLLVRAAAQVAKGRVAQAAKAQADFDQQRRLVRRMAEEIKLARRELRVARRRRARAALLAAEAEKERAKSEAHYKRVKACTGPGGFVPSAGQAELELQIVDEL